MNEGERVIALIDMDCFYVQVEERFKVENRGKPGCVVQYKAWKGGGIIAVNYEARARGVTRYLRGDEAREKCPEIILYRVPELRGKADLTRYREAGKEVIDVLCSFGVRVERASIDEAYLDLTSVIKQMQLTGPSVASLKPEDMPNTHIVGWSNSETDERGVSSWLQSLVDEELNEKHSKLALAAVLVEKMRSAVFEQTGFKCSAGIAANKMLAKLSCGLHKPNKQTVMPFESVQEFFRTLPLKKVRHLGGKLGLTLTEQLNCQTMGDIAEISEKILQQRFDPKTGTWLYWYCRGIDHELVSCRHLPKSIGCSKNFSGIAALDSPDKILHWLEELCAEIVERLQKDQETNQRTAKLLTITVRLEGDKRPASYARSVPLPKFYDKQRLVTLCMSVITKENAAKKSINQNAVVTNLGVSAGNFVSHNSGSSSKIDRFFSKQLTEGNLTEDADDKTESIDEEEPVSLLEKEGHSAEVIRLFGISSDQLSEENSKGSLPEPEGNQTTTINLAENLPHQEEGDPLVIREDPSSKKKKGFFASRSVKKPETKMSQPEAGNEEKFPFFCVNEIFPDLDHVDSETLTLLPLEIQRKVRQEMELRKGCKSQGGEFVDCDTCGKTILREEVAEHHDYHIAMELQKEMSLEASTSSAASNFTAQEASTRPAKRPYKESKAKTSARNSKRSRTIESFFTKTH